MEVRPEVAWFAEIMESQLRNNDHKGGWGNNWWLMRRLQEEFCEVMMIMSGAENGDIVKKCSDVANFAMMIADNIAHVVPQAR